MLAELVGVVRVHPHLPRGIHLGGDGGIHLASWEVTGVLYRGGVIKLPRALCARVFSGAKILAMLTVNHYIYALKLMPLTRY